MMAYPEPPVKRVAAFFDLQNLFLSAKDAWGYTYPNFDPVMLARCVVKQNPTWKLTLICLYTGLPDARRNPVWHAFWVNKLAAHQARDSRVSIFTAPLHYNNNVASEKGVDIRIALDLVRLARLNRFDTALLFSRDTDFAEAAREIRSIAAERSRWIKIASVFPDYRNFRRGIDGTDWIRLSKSDYDSCLDRNDYRLQ